MLVWSRISHKTKMGYGYFLRCLSQCPGWSHPLQWGPPPHQKSHLESSEGYVGLGSGQTMGYCSHSWNTGSRQYSIYSRGDRRQGWSKIHCLDRVKGHTIAVHNLNFGYIWIPHLKRSKFWIKTMTYLRRPWGILVLTKGIAPCLFNTFTTTQSSSAGSSTLPSTPQVESWL